MTMLSVSTTSDLLRTGLGFSSGTAESAVNVDFDASLLVHLALFLVLLVVLKPLLFDPMLKLFEEREKRIEGTRRAASKEDERSAHALAKYEAILAKAREAGGAERDALRAEGTKKEVDLMTRARSTVAAKIEQGRAETATDAKAARAALATEASALSRSIAAQVLGREVSS